MAKQQAPVITEVVARHLNLEIAPEQWAEEGRRDGAAIRDPEALAERVIDLGRRMEIAYLRRTVDRAALAELARRDAFPLVLVVEREAGAVEAVVLTRRDGRVIDGHVVGSGGERPFRADRGGLWRAVTERAPAASDGDGTLLCLLPMRVASAAAPDSDGARDAAERPTPVQRLIQLLVQEKRDIAVVYLYAALVGLFSLTLPLGVQAITGLVSGGLILQPVIVLIGFVILGTLITGILRVVQLSVVETLQQRVFARMALDFSFRIPRVGLERLPAAGLPEMTNRFFEVVTIQKSLSKLLTDATTALVSIVFGLVLLVLYHPYFSVFGIALLGTLALILWTTGKHGLSTSLTESTYKYKVAHWLQELARSLGVFKFADQSRLPVERMDAEVSGYLKYRRKHFAVLVRQMMSAVAFKTLITGGLLIMGSVLVIDRQITLGQFVASEIVIVTVLAGVEYLIRSLSDVYDILTAVEKAGHVSDLGLEPAGGTVRLSDDRGRGLAIVARGLTYRYPGADRDALAGIELTVRAGERVAITGAEGAGETTLLRVLTGLLPSYGGTLAYDNVSARDLHRGQLRELIAVNESEVTLFSGTLEENVSLGRPGVTVDHVLRAVDEVGLNEYLQGLPDGLATRIGADASRLPSNVERKIALARSLACRPRLLVFDEFFHHLEPAYKRQVIDRCIDCPAPWTVLGVSHDPVFLAACDRIYVLGDGRLTREGTYDELLTDPYFNGVLLARREPAALAR